MIFRRTFLALALLACSQAALASPLAIQAQSSLYTPQAAAYFNQITANGCTAPTAAQKVLAATFIKTGLAQGWWSKLNIFYELSNTQDACTANINWKATASFGLTVNGSPTWASASGYTGNGSTSDFLDTGWNPSTAGAGVYSLNSAHLMVWLLTSTASSSTVVGNGHTFITARNASNLATLAVNATTSATLANSDGSGMFLSTRDTAATSQMYRNAVSLGSTTNASTSISSANIYILCRNNAGCSTPSALSVCAASAGGTMSAGDVTNYYAALLVLLHGSCGV